MKPKLIDAPYQHNCELSEEYSVLSNRTGCIRKSDNLKTGYGQLFNREFMTHRGVNRVRVRLIWKPTKSYIYDHSVMIETIASKHNLVCRQTVFNSILTSTLFVGFTVGSALGGYLSDKYGQVWIFAFETIFNNCREARNSYYTSDDTSDQS